jgi:hypothetical protein
MLLVIPCYYSIDDKQISITAAAISMEAFNMARCLYQGNTKNEIFETIAPWTRRLTIRRGIRSPWPIRSFSIEPLAAVAEGARD